MDHHNGNNSLHNSYGNIRDPPPVMAKPALLPKPILHDKTTMRLRINFPSPDGNLVEELTERDIHRDDMTNGPGIRTPERKNSGLLTEGLLKAMRDNTATYEAEEYDDTFPDAVPPWLSQLNNERRDSIEQNRKKLGTKAACGASRAKNPRHRRGLRETRRSTGVAMFNEMNDQIYQDDDEDVAQETRTNTFQNEGSPRHHQLAQQTDLPPTNRTYNLPRPSGIAVGRTEMRPDQVQMCRGNNFGSSFDDNTTTQLPETFSRSAEPPKRKNRSQRSPNLGRIVSPDYSPISNPLSTLLPSGLPPTGIPARDAAHAQLFQALDSELDALIKGLQVTTNP